MIEQITYNYTEVMQQVRMLFEQSAKFFIPLSFGTAFVAYCIRILVNFFTSITGITR